MATAWRDRLEQLRRRPLVFVDDLENPRLTADDEHHLMRSLRIKPGAPLTISDGRGGWRPARFGAVPEPDGDIVVEARPHVTLTVGFAPVKGDRSDLVVQKLTELAIDEIVPLRAQRSVVRWDDARAAKNLQRHRRIVREAAMQSRNPWLPSVRPLTDLEVFLADRPETALADPAGPTIAGSQRSVAIGPEGGFTAAELSGRPSVLLPGGILRTETAAIATAVLLAAHRQARC